MLPNTGGVRSTSMDMYLPYSQLKFDAKILPFRHIFRPGLGLLKLGWSERQNQSAGNEEISQNESAKTALPNRG